MLELTRVLDQSHGASIRLALEGAGIEAVFMPSTSNTGGRFRSESCYVVHDRDFERAAAIVSQLQQTGIQDVPVSRFFVVAVLMLTLVGVVALWLRGHG